MKPSCIRILKVSELKYDLVLKVLKFEYRINTKYMLHKYHMGRAAAVASRRGVTHVVFIWHVFDINSVFKFHTFYKTHHVSVIKPSNFEYSFGFTQKPVRYKSNHG